MKTARTVREHRYPGLDGEEAPPVGTLTARYPAQLGHAEVVVRSALAALAPFYVEERSDAEKLLQSWRHKDLLTPAVRERILAHFRDDTDRPEPQLIRPYIRSTARRNRRSTR